MRGVAILGSTGSIGKNTLDVIATAPEQFRVVALAAGRNRALLLEQIERFSPELVSLAEEDDAANLRDELAAKGVQTDVRSGIEGAEAVAAHDGASVVVTAMVGAVGLRPTLVAIRRGVTVAIANKEPLVVAGALCTAEAARCGATLLPVDSEHSAIFQCLAGQRKADVSQLYLTCSGGPFRLRQDLSSVTVDEALKHPTWTMGPKITIDSATLMNKGLEVIEAHFLFGMPAEKIDVVIHPQSVVHSMVEFVDGSVIAQLGTPDMRAPISFALAHPARLPLTLPRLDWRNIEPLSFDAPDRDRFPALNVAYDALHAGGTAPAVVNAANEVAVAAFLQRQIAYLEIVSTIRRTLDDHQVGPALDLQAILAADRWAREKARSLIGTDKL